VKTGRNDPCPCGSGKKYKRCCGKSGKSPSRPETGNPGLDINHQLAAAGKLYTVGKSADAAAICRQILAHRPGHAGALCLLGRITLRHGDSNKATELFKTALKTSPTDIQLQYFCGRALGESGRFNEAVPYLKRAIKLDPGFAEGYNFLGTLLHVMGKTDQAASLTLKSVQLDRTNPPLHSHQLVSSHSSSRYSASDIFSFHKEWGKRHASRFYTKSAHTNAPDPGRKIKLGYVSTNFNRNIVGYFFKTVFDKHRRDDFEIFCYSNTQMQDDYTDYFARNSNWRDIAKLNDEGVVKRICEDEIDILVDLSGHTPNNRLLVFARKPAPVQVTWLDYFDTTGLETMDYLITDPVSTPQDSTQQFVEEPVRMPHTRLCWSPPEFAPEVNELPALGREYITFGSFNRPEKITCDVIHVWAKILREIPDSRLVLKNRNLAFDNVQQHFLNAFHKEGVAADRVEMRGGSAHKQVLGEYGDIDIALDTFPYNGGATTCDALWMGVPVITLEGDRMISRQTMSILSSIGLTDFIADNKDSYVDIAVEWSDKINQLAEIRKKLRGLLASSPVCDAGKFTSDLEDIYRKIWKTWCAQNQKRYLNSSISLE
jgi:predicted O-linked N-acetylglucosamine transferase (SPINDLY family)